MTSFRESQPGRSAGALPAAPVVAGQVAGLGSLSPPEKPGSAAAGAAAAATTPSNTTTATTTTEASGAQAKSSQEHSSSDQLHRQMGRVHPARGLGGSLEQQDSPASLGSQRCLSFTFGSLSPLGSPIKPPGFLQAQHQQFPGSPSQLPKQLGFQPAQSLQASPATSPQRPRGFPSPRSIRLTGSVRLVGDTIIPLPAHVGGRLIEALEAAVPAQSAAAPLSVEEQQRRLQSSSGAELVVRSLEGQGTSFPREPSFHDMLVEQQRMQPLCQAQPRPSVYSCIPEQLQQQQHAKRQQDQEEIHEQCQQQPGVPSVLAVAAVQVISTLDKNFNKERMHGAAALGAAPATTLTGRTASTCAGLAAASPPASGPTTPPEAGLLLTPRKRARKGRALRSAYDDEMDPTSKVRRSV